MIEEGEHVCQDFKYTINDPVKIARTLSAFANNRGGRLLIGVDDNGRIRGVRNEEDIYVVDAAANVYCTPPCKVEYTAFKDSGGATVIRAEIAADSRKPCFVKEAPGKLKAYYRVDDENLLMEPLMVKAFRYAADPSKASVFSLDTQHSELLAAIDSGITFEQLAYRVDIHRKRLEQIILQLFDMNLISFVYKKRILYICPVKDEENNTFL